MKVTVLLRALNDAALAEGFTGSTWRLDDPSLTAIELALRLREEGPVTTIGIGAGPPDWAGPLREAVALGLDSARRAWSDGLEMGDIVAHATALAAAIEPETGLLVAGGPSTDAGSGALPAAVAELLGWPLISDVTGITLTDDEVTAQARASGGRRLTLRAPLPCAVVCARQAAPALMAPVARRLRASRLTVPTLPTDARAAPERYTFAGYGPPRPLTRRLLRPDTSARAGKRLSQLMAGGMGTARKSLAGEGDFAAQVANLLEEEGLIPRD